MFLNYLEFAWKAMRREHKNRQELDENREIEKTLNPLRLKLKLFSFFSFHNFSSIQNDKKKKIFIHLCEMREARKVMTEIYWQWQWWWWCDGGQQSLCAASKFGSQKIFHSAWNFSNFSTRSIQQNHHHH